MYQADEGKVWDFAVPREDGTHLYGRTLYLGKGDSIDNYIQIDEAEMNAYYAEQEKLEKKAREQELLEQLSVLYPEEYKEDANNEYLAD